MQEIYTVGRVALDNPTWIHIIALYHWNVFSSLKAWFPIDPPIPLPVKPLYHGTKGTHKVLEQLIWFPNTEMHEWMNAANTLCCISDRPGMVS